MPCQCPDLNSFLDVPHIQVLLVAWALGLIITIVIKMVLVKTCRKRFYAGFYRTNPNAANLAILALECWFIGMGGGGKKLCCSRFLTSFVATTILILSTVSTLPLLCSPCWSIHAIYSCRLLLCWKDRCSIPFSRSVLSCVFCSIVVISISFPVSRFSFHFMHLQTLVCLGMLSITYQQTL